MAETSGFFEAEWDESIEEWDRRYLAEEYAKYFSLFIGNGVFASPTNQLKVIQSSEPSMNVIVKEGFAFIDGYWYNNDSNLVLNVPQNSTSSTRVDTVRVRLDISDRTIKSLYIANDDELVRNDLYYDLELAQILVSPFASAIYDSNIADTRTNESLCGFVKGLLEVETTADLFAQFQSQFEQWFDTVKDQITEDMAVILQNQIYDLENSKENAFEKNTAFNKNFGNSSGTVCEGNDERLSNARPASDVYNWAKQQNKPSYSKSEVGLGNVDNTSDAKKEVLSATKLKTPRKIGNANFDGTTDISLLSIGVKEIILSDTEPSTVSDNTIVFVYED